jgi:hypothetical protein
MKSGVQFRPAVNVCELEARVVPSHTPARHVYSVVIGGFHPNSLALKQNQTASVLALVNASFDQFQQDYSQTRATYLAAVANNTATLADKGAFNAYTNQRVNLLGQQLVNSFLRSLASTLHTPGTPPPLSAITRKIDGANPGTNASNTTAFAGGTLGFSLISTTPDPTASTTTVALESLAQDNAIEAARVAMIDTVNVIKNGDFGNGSTHAQKH